MKRCRRDDATGEWPCEASPPPPPRLRPRIASTSFSRDGGRPVRDLAPSIAMVGVDIPFRVDGVHGDRFRGPGLVVDAEQGLVVVDRETVPIALGDVTITFAESVQVSGEVVYLHPAHNLALVRYDAALLGDTPVRSVTFRPESLESGDEVWLVGLSGRQRLISRKTRVSRVEALRISLSDPPRFRETNIEQIGLSDSTATLGGVISDDKGRVYALWAAFSVDDDGGPKSIFAGIPARAVVDMLDIARSGGSREWRSLGVELYPINLADARNRGLGEKAARRIESHKESRRQVLSVVRLTAGTPAAEILREGDLLLSIDGRPAESFAVVERAAQAERVSLTVLRDGEELSLDVGTTAQSGRGTGRFLFWQGTLLQMPHPAVSAQRGVEPGGVYVSWFWYGSPANRSRLRATHRIVELDGVPIPDLDAFLAIASDRPNGRAVRLKTLDLDGKASVVTLKPDPRFWPTSEIRRGPDGWERVNHEAGDHAPTTGQSR
jgi:S1-C subfamily serine protease